MAREGVATPVARGGYSSSQLTATTGRIIFQPRHPSPHRTTNRDGAGRTARPSQQRKLPERRGHPGGTRGGHARSCLQSGRAPGTASALRPASAPAQQEPTRALRPILLRHAVYEANGGQGPGGEKRGPWGSDVRHGTGLRGYQKGPTLDAGTRGTRTPPVVELPSGTPCRELVAPSLAARGRGLAVLLAPPQAVATIPGVGGRGGLRRLPWRAASLRPPARARRMARNRHRAGVELRHHQARDGAATKGVAGRQRGARAGRSNTTN